MRPFDRWTVPLFYSRGLERFCFFKYFLCAFAEYTRFLCRKKSRTTYFPSEGQQYISTLIIIFINHYDDFTMRVTMIESTLLKNKVVSSKDLGRYSQVNVLLVKLNDWLLQ